MSLRPFLSYLGSLKIVFHAHFTHDKKLFLQGAAFFVEM